MKVDGAARKGGSPAKMSARAHMLLMITRAMASGGGQAQAFEPHGSSPMFFPKRSDVIKSKRMKAHRGRC